MTNQSINLAAVGDLSPMGRHGDYPSIEVLGPSTKVFKDCDLAIANLEGPLEIGGQAAKGKCCLRCDPGWGKVLIESGINMVTLANNHSMDYGEEGLISTIKTLKSIGLEYVGAGMNKKEACAPKFMDIKGKRIAFLGRTSIAVSSRSYAEENLAGVAFLDIVETKRCIKKCKESADFVILLIHWGLEDYLYPSPEQRQLAKEFVEAGVNLILGHHPHVLQGIEKIGKCIVAHSLGNFLMDEFEWSLDLPGVWQMVGEGKIDNPMAHDMPFEWRQTIILKASIKENNQIDISTVFTQLDKDTMIISDNYPKRKERFDSLSKKLSSDLYRYWWRFYAMEREWSLRIKSRFALKKIVRKIWKLRPSHFKELYQLVRRSSRVTSGNSTNPYEDK